MPEMDGFEVLNIMQEDPKLKAVPIVVMSAEEINDVIADCLRKGAMNFLVKPVRIQQCMSLVGFMKLMPAEEDTEKKEKGLARFEKIRGVGRGAAGIVDLVRSKSTG